MDQHNTNSSDDEYVDAQSSINFINGNTSSVLLSPSPSSSSTSSIFSPGSSTTTTSAIQTNNGNSIVPNADEELTQELIAKGWRKCFSRRENRYYYFNHLTNKSIWSFPQYDQFSDPLGINSDDLPMTPITPTTPVTTPPSFSLHQAKPGEKRSISDVDPVNGAVANKKPYFVPINFWDIDSQTTVVIFERGLFIRLHINPEIEQQRCALAFRLRNQFNDICHSRGITEVPREAFNRWLMERKIVDRGTDELLMSNSFPEMSRILYYEILNNIPIRLTRPKYTVDARKQLTRYAEGAKKMIESNTSVSSESRKIVKWSAEEVFTFIRKTNNATFEEYESRLQHMIKQCQPHLNESMKNNVERICSKLYHFSCDYAKEIREKEIKYITNELKQDVIHGVGYLKLSNPPKRVFAYPIQLAYKSPPKLPAIHYMMNEKDPFIILRYKQEGVRLRKEYLFKLEQCYRYNCWDDKKFELFIARVWCMLKRYQTYWGLTTTLSSRDLPPLASEVSLPLKTFECMKKHFQVTFECFASPLNAYFRNYCSLFADTDGYFGSNGSFLNFVPLTGSLAAFPPFFEPLLDVSFDHIDRCLSSTQEPLSFIIFLEVTEYPSNSRSVDKLSKSKFKRKQFVLQPQTYEIRSGAQFLFNPLDCNQKSNAHLLIVFLQNDAGFISYGPTPERMESFLESLKIHEPTPHPVVQTTDEKSSSTNSLTSTTALSSLNQQLTPTNSANSSNTNITSSSAEIA